MQIETNSSSPTRNHIILNRPSIPHLLHERHESDLSFNDDNGNREDTLGLMNPGIQISVASPINESSIKNLQNRS
jgi:hypothetical protein